MTDFLVSFRGSKRTWHDADRVAEERGIYAHRQFFGMDAEPLEVKFATADGPSVTKVREVWKRLHDHRAAPVLLVVAHPRTNPVRAMVCGPRGDRPPVVDVELGLAERVAGAALAEPNRHLAARFLESVLLGGPNATPGMRNHGLLASYALQVWVREEFDWEAACRDSHPMLAARGQELISCLGFAIERRGQHQVLRNSQGGARAVAVFLEEGETEEQASPRFDGQSPVTSALAVADRENLPWVLSIRGGTLRLYATGTSGAPGQRGRTETYFELNLSVLDSADAGHLVLIFSAEALEPGGSLERIREASRLYTSHLSRRLRERIYDDVVPRLALGVARAEGTSDPEALDRHFLTALVIVFRLLFIAYAEDSRLLPLDVNGDYTDHALKTRALRIAEGINGARPLGFRDPFGAVVPEPGDQHEDVGTDLWDGCQNLFRAVERGAPRWGVPAYGGGLFHSDPAVSPSGASIAALSLTNGQFGPALAALLVDRTPDGAIGPIDFGSLSVREFGTIYEGLLSSQLALAETDLRITAAGGYEPSGPEEAVDVAAGEVYLHGASGERRSSGAYFTKPFAVDHLLDHALDPALDRHLEEVQRLLDAGREADASDVLFDFRVADIAMGSGHFLTAAVDRIEARFSNFLLGSPIGHVRAQLDRLRRSAEEALREIDDAPVIEGSPLLRRLIARRCVYGVDVNPLAVELARVAMWIHTFVPGLPLSFLDHNLRVGNSLTGVGSRDEVLAAFRVRAQGGQVGFLDDPVDGLLEAASEPLARLSGLIDASATEVAEARAAWQEAVEALAPLRSASDLIALARVGAAKLPAATSGAELSDAIRAATDARPEGSEVLAALRPAHFMTLFPEVFTRSRPGFDVILSNPPYKEVVVEELAFWAMVAPGLNALPGPERISAVERLRRERPDLVARFEREQVAVARLRESLSAGPFPGMSVGDPDLYKAFCWRFLQLLREGGSLGIVLPRGVFATKGSGEWRRTLIPASRTFVTTLRNTGEWVFDDVNPGYTFVLLAATGVGSRTEHALRLAGRYDGLDSYSAGMDLPAVEVDIATLAGRAEELTLPDLGSSEEARLFVHLMGIPQFGDEHRPDFRARPHRELDASIDRKKTGILKPEGDTPVYNHRNIGHFAFEPDKGEFLRCDREEAFAVLRERMRKGAKHRTSPFAELLHARGAASFDDPDALPAKRPRLAFRDVIHASNERKVWFALVPAGTLLTNPAPYLLFPRGDETDEAYVMALMNSSVCDWYGHLFVNLHLNYFILNDLPLPVRDPADPLAGRVIALAAALAVVPGRDYGPIWPRLAADDVRDPDEAVAELDGIASLLYGLSDEHLPLIWSDDADRKGRPGLGRVRQYRERWGSLR